MPYQIITDSCCDLSPAQYQACQAESVSLTLMMDGISQENFTQPQQIDAFYDRLRQGVSATTSAVNPDSWKQRMEPALARGEDVLALSFSSGLSTTWQSAVIAAQELKERYPDRKVHVCDTLCAALGQGFLVHHACLQRDRGMDFDSLCRWVEANKLRVSHWFTVEDLNHLRRGGRISPTAAILGTMLNVKPVLHMDCEGHLQPQAKVRGRKTAISYLARKAADTAGSLDCAFIAQGGCPEDAAQLETLLKEMGFREVHTGYVGPVIGAHTGPGVLALFFWGTER